MEVPVLIPHGQIEMVGVVHRPENNIQVTGVIIVVGGPQNRWGSHRQFLLLARYLCNQGIPVLRFDFGGMGDSEGEKQDFLDAGPYLKSATDFFIHGENLTNIVMWGLCDAVSVILLYLNSWQDRRVSSVIALNPWVRQTQTQAQVFLKNYYWRQLFNSQLWKRIFTLQFEFLGSLKSFLPTLKNAVYRPLSADAASVVSEAEPWENYNEENYVAAMLTGLKTFSGHFYLLLSGNDLTADEFKALMVKNPAWKNVMSEKCKKMLEVVGANHTFASQQWRSEVEEFTYACVISSLNCSSDAPR